MFRLTPVVKYLLIINIVIFLITAFLKLDGLISYYFALKYIRADSFMPFQFITYMFLHAGFGHLFSNMFALFIFGPAIENTWGSRQFLVYYMITGIGAAILFSATDYFEKRELERDASFYVVNPSPDAYSDFIAEHMSKNSRLANINNAYQLERAYHNNPSSDELRQRTKSTVKEYSMVILNSPMLGASGAIFGILIAFGMLFPDTRIFLLLFPVPIKAKYLIAFYAVAEIFYGIKPVAGDNVAHLAHIGGMLVGYLIIKFWFKGGHYQRF